MILEDIAAEPPSSLPLTPTSDGDTTTRPAVDTSTPSTHRAASLDGGAPSSAGKSGAATERWQNGKSKVILKMKVAIGDGRQGTIHVFPGDDPKALAAQFCEKHELTEPKMLRVVEKHIADNIAKLPAHRRKAAEGRRKKEAAAAGPAAAPAADSPAAPRTAPARQKSRKAAAAPAPADEADEAAAPAAAPAVAVPPPRPPTPPTAAPAPAAAPAVAVPPPPPPPPEEPPPAAAFRTPPPPPPEEPPAAAPAIAVPPPAAAPAVAVPPPAAAPAVAVPPPVAEPPEPPEPAPPVGGIAHARWVAVEWRARERRAGALRAGWGALVLWRQSSVARKAAARARAEMDEFHEANSRIAELAFAQAGQPAEVSHHQLLEAMAPKAAMLEADDVKQAAAAKVARLQRKLDGALARLGASAVGAKQVATLTAAFAAFKMVLVARDAAAAAVAGTLARDAMRSPLAPAAAPAAAPAPSPAIAVPPPAVAVPPSPLRAAPTFPSVEEAAVQCALGDEQARRASVAASSAADEVRAEVDALKEQLAQREEELHDVTQMLIDARIQHAEINGVSLDLKHELRRAEVALEESRWDAAGAHAESFSKGSSGRKLGLSDRRLSFPSIKSPSMGMGSGKRLSMGRDTK